MASRAFVLVPLREIAPGWHHPVTGLTADVMLRRLKRSAEGRILEPA
jgi:2-amino-4-hydroxy-6-hydroxymethyldihydropteridine diphosphokinase